MMENKFFIGLSKFQEVFSDVAKIGTQEIKLGLNEAKNQIKKYGAVQKRKECLALLGQYAYEFYSESPEHTNTEFFKLNEVKEIIEELKDIDNNLQNLAHEKADNEEPQK